MRLVINIPDDVYRRQDFVNYYGAWSGRHQKTISNGQPLSEILDKISAEIKEKSFTEEIFDEEIFKSTYTENVTRETAEEESVIETEIVKLSDILEIIEKYKEEVGK